MNFFKHFKENRILYPSIEALVIVTTLFILTKLDFLFNPLGTFVSALFAPILISGFLYYLLNPIVKLLEKKLKLKRIFGIIIVFLLLIAILAVAFLNLIPNLLKQMSDLAKHIPSYINAIQAWALDLTKSALFKNVNLNSYIKNLDLSYGSIISNTLNGATKSLGSIFSVITSTLMTIVTVPFILFYMLKDGEKFLPKMISFIPKKNRKSFIYLFNQMNDTIATYISGQVIECCFVGTCMVIGYLALGIEYGFLFGIIAGLTNLIPYLGPYLGLAPAFLATVFNNPIKGIFCIILVIIVQQLDGNIIYPNVIGKTLKIHPLTIIFVLLVAGSLAGLVGILLGVPVYAISKTILKFILTIYHGRKEQEEMTRQEELLK